MNQTYRQFRYETGESLKMALFQIRANKTRSFLTALGALQSRGVRKGDRVIIYMPMIPEAVVGS